MKRDDHDGQNEDKHGSHNSNPVNGPTDPSAATDEDMFTMATYAVPGTFILLVGIFMLFRAFNVSIQRAKLNGRTEKKESNEVPRATALFPSTRRSSIFLSIELNAMAILGVLSSVIEFFSVKGDWTDAHMERFRIVSLVAIAGIIGLLHFRRKIVDLVWGITSNLCIAMTGVLLNTKVTAKIIYAIALIRIVNLIVGEYTNTKHHQKVYTSYEETEGNDSSRLIRNTGVHSAYTNPIVFTTFLPLLDAFLFCYLGVWLWHIGVMFYVNPDLQRQGGHNGDMYAMDTLYDCSVLMTISTLGFYLFVRKIAFMACGKQIQQAEEQTALQQQNE
ncbi:hypothetical protein PROFUN_02126 [Planoprotostelium fungivorum]|uniref:Uncharacterized protein n=1 Tax=Planoprotostelium fungivorum TaxID=1890364 RepID=A0A2P6NZ74_9EUKA|nr:hypothetical protein PROFUN_02126 [Planoprotostelium fungivorum]